MTPVVIWTLVALGAAVVVMVVAANVTSEGGLRQLLTDLRSGLRPESRHELFADLREDVEDTDDDASVDDIFAVGQPTDTAYLDPARLTAPLERAGTALRTVPAPRRRTGTAPRC